MLKLFFHTAELRSSLSQTICLQLSVSCSTVHQAAESQVACILSMDGYHTCGRKSEKKLETIMAQQLERIILILKAILYRTVPLGHEVIYFCKCMVLNKFISGTSGQHLVDCSSSYKHAHIAHIVSQFLK